MKRTPAPTPTPLPRGAIKTAMRESGAVRAALARLRPAERDHARNAIAEQIRARLRREGWSE